MAREDKDLEVEEGAGEQFHKHPQFLPPSKFRKLRIREDNDVNRDDTDTDGADPDLWLTD